MDINMSGNWFGTRGVGCSNHLYTTNRINHLHPVPPPLNILGLPRGSYSWPIPHGPETPKVHGPETPKVHGRGQSKFSAIGFTYRPGFFRFHVPAALWLFASRTFADSFRTNGWRDAPSCDFR